MKLVLKRAIDISVSAAALLLLLPLIALIAVLVRVRMGRPVLFIQERPGLSGKAFRVCKFRTMSNDWDEAGNLKADADRLSVLGRWLRRLSLDEIPQLWNVLRGDMSLVGPRPLLMEYLPLYNAKQARRHDVRPGITGWAQINGRNAISWEEKFDLDVWYVDNWSLSLDVLILLRTVRNVVRREGVSTPGHATTAKFTGQTQ